MLKLLRYISFTFILLITIQCKKNESKNLISSENKNSITDASGLAIYEYTDYTIVKVTTPWPKAQKSFIYVLAKENAQIPDSLQQYQKIQVPLKNIIVTSTTNIPFLEILGAENKLIGFPHTDYISSPKTRQLIAEGKVKNIGENEKINIEQVIDLSPSALVTFGVDGNNPTLNQIEKSGIPVLIQADWMEQTPLGKAEWIKFFGVLLGKEKEAKIYFEQIKKNYQEAIQLVQNTKTKPTVMYGTMYQDQWYMAKGDSWIGQFIKDAQGDYLWNNLKGSGSEPLTFEQVFEKGQSASIWIATGSITNWKAFGESNTHYSQFKAYKEKKVFTFEAQKGPTGGVIFFELSPSQPDKILKDYIKIFHPELLPNYQLTFATPIE